MSGPEKPSWTTKEGWARGDDAEKELLKEGLRPDIEVSQRMFYIHLHKSDGGMIQETYKLAGGSLIDLREWSPEGRPTMMEIVSIMKGSPCVIRDAPVYTPGDVQTAAADLMKEYRDIEFEFPTDPAGKTFTCIAKVVEQKEKPVGHNPWTV